jgi:threonine/homoserine/homoserine lactone efflux protein
MSGPSPLNIVFVVIFVMIGLFMSFLGLSFLFAGPGNETEWTITIFSLLAAFFLFYGARQTWQNHFRQQKAEQQEASRLAKKFNVKPATNSKTIPEAEHSSLTAERTEPTNKVDGEPKILARWLYPKREWNSILNKLAEKTRKEELYTAFWFPVIFALVFWSFFWVGILAGLAFGAFYVWFRTNYVKSNFAIRGNSPQAEVIITDSYMRVNGNFVHYGDGKYFLKDLIKVHDKKLGELLLFEIGWITSKGLPAQLDLYLPIPVDKRDEADEIMAAFKRAKL